MDRALDAIDGVVSCVKDSVVHVFSDERLFDLEVALVEVLTNAVRHGQPTVPGQRIGVEVDLDGTDITLTVHDTGAALPVDLFEVAPPLDEVDPMAERGRGLSLVVKMADRVRVLPQVGNNRIELTFSGKARP